MRTIKFFAYAVFVLFLGVAISSCKGDDGTDGIDGATGPAGADGQDGNANVQTLTYDISTESGYGINTSVPELTQSVLENDVILSYLKSHNNLFFSIPGTVGSSIVAGAVSTVGVFGISFHNWDGTGYNLPAGTFTTLKIVIIESSSKNAGNKNPQEEIYTELKNAGVDINDYYDVCDYYGINP